MQQSVQCSAVQCSEGTVAVQSVHCSYDYYYYPFFGWSKQLSLACWRTNTSFLCSWDRKSCIIIILTDWLTSAGWVGTYLLPRMEFIQPKLQLCWIRTTLFTSRTGTNEPPSFVRMHFLTRACIIHSFIALRSQSGRLRATYLLLTYLLSTHSLYVRTYIGRG